LVVDGNELVARTNPLEVFGALHRSVRVPLSSVVELAATSDLWNELHGTRLPGTGLPGVIALGTWRYPGGKDFVAVYRGYGVLVTVSDSTWHRLLVSDRNPDRTCHEINIHR
jgi:hypothetical protein